MWHCLTVWSSPDGCFLTRAVALSYVRCVRFTHGAPPAPPAPSAPSAPSAPRLSSHSDRLQKAESSGSLITRADVEHIAAVGCKQTWRLYLMGLGYWESKVSVFPYSYMKQTIRLEKRGLLAG